MDEGYVTARKINGTLGRKYGTNYKRSVRYCDVPHTNFDWKLLKVAADYVRGYDPEAELVLEEKPEHDDEEKYAMLIAIFQHGWLPCKQCPAWHKGKECAVKALRWGFLRRKPFKLAAWFNEKGELYGKRVFAEYKSVGGLVQ